MFTLFDFIDIILLYVAFTILGLAFVVCFIVGPAIEEYLEESRLRKSERRKRIEEEEKK